MTESIAGNAEFISQIIHDVDLGRAFVPLLGSGISSPSGIIMGVEFTEYLAFTTYLTLSDPNSRQRTHGEGQQSRWKLQINGWPPYPSETETEQARDWISKEFKELCMRQGYRPNFDGTDRRIQSLTAITSSRSDEIVNKISAPPIPMILASQDAEWSDDRLRRLLSLMANRNRSSDQPPVSSSSFIVDKMATDASRSYTQRVVEIGLRSLHDWRETLVFLSSLQIERTRGGTDRLVLGPQDPSIIDAFNQFITRDKQPNLGHKMLAHLAGPMRISTILTTNFDTLMEDAYRILGLPLRVVPVTTNGRLPNAKIVATSNTLIKLHGEAQSTRADLSLDEEPSDYDLETFAEYLTRGAGNLGVSRLDYTTYDATRAFRDTEAGHAGRGIYAAESKRLLVVGYSGSDHRCVQMIKNWLEHGPPDAGVYWVCYSKNDVKKIGTLFSAEQYRGRVRITRSSRPDLMLYELYQRLQLSLTPGGLKYQFTQNVPPTRRNQFDKDIGRVNRFIETIDNQLNKDAAQDFSSAARQHLDGTPNADHERDLIRDSMAAMLRDELLSIVGSKPNFFSPDGSYRPRNRPFLKASPWAPYYRWAEGKTPTDPSVRDYCKDHEVKRFPIVIDTAGSTVRGTALATDELEAVHYKKVFWLELCDYSDVDALLRDLLRSIANRFGQFQSTYTRTHPFNDSIHGAYQSKLNEISSATDEAGIKSPPKPSAVSEAWLSVAKDLAEYFDSLLQHYRVDPQQFIFFFYGRDSAGNGSGIMPTPWKSVAKTDGNLAPNDSSEHINLEDSSETNQSSPFASFHCLLESFGRVGIPTVYFPLSIQRANWKSKISDRLGISGQSQQAFTQNWYQASNLNAGTNGDTRIWFRRFVESEDGKTDFEVKTIRNTASTSDQSKNEQRIVERESIQDSLQREYTRHIPLEFRNTYVTKSGAENSETSTPTSKPKSQVRLIDDEKDWMADPILPRQNSHRQLDRDVRWWFEQSQLEDYTVFHRIYHWITKDLGIFDPENYQNSKLPHHSNPYRLGEIFGRMQFIYALTLFRQSRHGNALCTEAALPCPFRFNILGIDNDFARGEIVAQWIEELRARRVFFDKPGGSVWIHRDVRLCIQRFLGAYDCHRGCRYKNSADSSGQPPFNRFLFEIRSRLHAWIAQWYHQGYLSSGHIDPVIESLHHRFASATHAAAARPKTLSGMFTFVTNEHRYDKHSAQEFAICLIEHRMRLLFRAMTEMTKTIRIAFDDMRHWQAAPFEPTWISQDTLKEIEYAMQIAYCEVLANSHNEVRNPLARSPKTSLVKRSAIERVLDITPAEVEGVELNKVTKSPILKKYLSDGVVWNEFQWRLYSMVKVLSELRDAVIYDGGGEVSSLPKAMFDEHATTMMGE